MYVRRVRKEGAALHGQARSYDSMAESRHLCVASRTYKGARREIRNVDREGKLASEKVLTKSEGPWVPLDSVMPEPWLGRMKFRFGKQKCHRA
jgi:hypothetical protein